MAGQENLRGCQPEEPLLPETEAGEKAYDLIYDAKQRLQRTPEFIQALLGIYFDEAPRAIYDWHEDTNSFKELIHFEKGDHKYGVQYISRPEKEYFRLIKTPRRGIEHDKSEEEIVLVSYIDSFSERFEDGAITYTKVDSNGEIIDAADTTRTAVHRVKDFFTTDFPRPQAQPTTEK